MKRLRRDAIHMRERTTASGISELMQSNAIMAKAIQMVRLVLPLFFSPNSGYTEGVLTVRVKAGCSLRCSLWPGGFVCAGMPFWNSMLISTAQARTKSAARKSQFRRRRFTGCSCTFLDMNVISWQVQGIRHLWRSETWVYVAGARNRTHCENCGRRSISWTLPKRWQARVIRRIAFYVAGARNPHHGSYILRSKGSIPERGGIFGTWAWGTFCVASAAFRMTSAHDFVAGAVLLKHGFEMWTLCGDRACRVRGMQVKFRFLISKCNPLRTSCVSSARNAGEIAISDFAVQPSAEIVRVECAECRWNCDFGFRSATLCGDRACPSREILVKLRFLISYKDLAQEVLQEPDADILTERSCTRDPHTEILHKRS